MKFRNLFGFAIGILTMAIEIAFAQVYPIQFSLSETKMVKQIPHKDQDFAFIIPGQLNTYIYSEEADYYKEYQRSLFAVTTKRGGWDCLRHYEILANGCIPYFVGLEHCNPHTMAFLPRDLILEAMHLPGVSYLKIDHSQFDKARYDELLNQILDHTHRYLTSKSIAAHLLTTVQYTGSGNILFLCGDIGPDYLRCCTLIGLKELLGERVVDIPKIPHIYKSYPDDVKKLYGKGFSYTKVIDDILIDRENIEQRIKNKEFDLIVYGSVHRGAPFYNLVLENYDENQILYMCGEEGHRCQHVHLPHLFLREHDDY